MIDFGSSCFTTDHLSSYVQSRSYRAPEVVLGFAKAEGAAVISADNCETVGDAPDSELIMQLAHWLGQRHDQLVFQSDCISRDIPHLPALAEHCAGVMAISISRLHAHYLIWFRREQVKTVNWAGIPRSFHQYVRDMESSLVGTTPCV